MLICSIKNKMVAQDANSFKTLGPWLTFCVRDPQSCVCNIAGIGLRTSANCSLIVSFVHTPLEQIFCNHTCNSLWTSIFFLILAVHCDYIYRPCVTPKMFVLSSESSDCVDIGLDLQYCGVFCSCNSHVMLTCMNGT